MFKLVIDGKKITSKAGLYESIAEQLPVPAWFGKNLDALCDVLTCDLMPKDTVCVKICAAAVLRDNLGGYADALLGMLGDLAESDSRLTVEIN